MLLNSDFSKRVVLLPTEQQFVPSPMAGVSRILLDRAGDEIARATSIVRYAAGAGYHQHRHDGGEEILVLDGIFADEHGEYPTGTYLRNPPGTSHTPFSVTGCTLLVKLWQFAATDLTPLLLRPDQQQWQPGVIEGLTVLPLHDYDGVQTALVRFAPNTNFKRHVHVGGEEILLLQGCLYDEFGQYPQGSWLRSPAYSQHQPFTKAEGALLYVKVGFIDAGLLGDQFLATPAQG